MAELMYEDAEGNISEDQLFDACRCGEVAMLQWWAKKGIRISSGEPLVQAALKGKLEVMRCLVTDLGADANQPDDEGHTPLSVAAQEGDLPAVQCLVKELGANVNKGVFGGRTPLYIAAEKGHVAMIRCLVTELGADLCQTESGAMPLHVSAEEGHLAVVRFLIEELGAEIDQARGDGATALMIAASKNRFKIVAYLLKHGADPQLSQGQEGTAADISKSFGASDKQTTYLEAKTHCSKPGCAGAGRKKCTGCKQVRYCGEQCQLAHWPVHKAECKEAAKNEAEKRN
jgi:ankyrin repeat protein